MVEEADAANNPYVTTTMGGYGGSGIVVVRYVIGSSQTQLANAKATGGDISFTPTAVVHTFRTSGTFTVTDSSLSSVDYLVVAGGGGGGGAADNSTGAGGGGAGGLKSSHPSVPAPLRGSALPVGPGPYTVTVGAGGAGGKNALSAPTAGQTRDVNGSNSVFGPITSTGGGSGGSNTNNQNHQEIRWFWRWWWSSWSWWCYAMQPGGGLNVWTRKSWCSWTPIFSAVWVVVAVALVLLDWHLLVVMVCQFQFWYCYTMLVVVQQVEELLDLVAVEQVEK